MRAAEPSDRLECSHRRLACGLSKHAQQGCNVGDSRREDVLDEADGGKSDCDKTWFGNLQNSVFYFFTQIKHFLQFFVEFLFKV